MMNAPGRNLAPILLACTLSAFVAAGEPARAFPLFPNPVATTGSTPRSVVLGDFNEDGVLDAALALPFGPDVEVLLGTGDGQFGPAVSYPVPLSSPVNANYVVTADFNGDGHLDLASSSPLTVLFGRGDGTFQAPVNTGFTVGALAAADMNRDGAPDLVSANQSSLCLFLNQGGTGSFAAPACQPLYFSATSVTIADFNGDGWPDAAAGGPGYIAVSYSNAGSLAPGTTIHTLGILNCFNCDLNKSIISADVNRDGRPDLVSVYNTTVNPSPGVPTGFGFVTVLLQNGSGSFNDPLSISAQPTVTTVATGDFNHDGNPDLALGGPYSEGILELKLGLGDGSFQPSAQYGAGGYLYGLAAGDLNRDGRMDVAATTANGLVAFLGRLGGTFLEPGYGSGGGTGSDVVTTDLNGDGHADLIVVESLFDRIAVMLGRGDGTFGDPVRYATDDNPKGLVLGDFNEDGHTDVATGLQSGVAVLLGAGDGTFGTATTFSGGEAHSAIVAGDFNSDGHLDLASTNTTGVDLSVLLGAGDGRFGGHTRYPSATNPVGLATGDIDGDGILDLVAGSRDGPSGFQGFAVLHGLGNGSFSPPVLLGLGSIPGRILIADLNGDGIPDLLGSKNGAGSLAWLPGLGAGSFGPRHVFPSVSPSAVALADLNGDGHLDVAAAGPAYYCDVGVYTGDGDGTFAPPLRFASPLANGMVIADFNEDGALDIATVTATPDNSVTANFPEVMLLINANAGPPPEHAPVAAAGPNQSFECTAWTGMPFVLDGSGSSDLDSTPGTTNDIASYEWFEHFGQPAQTLLGRGVVLPVSLPLGAHDVTLRVTDGSGRIATDDMVATVADTLPPTGSALGAPVSLWPPNHRMLPFDVQVTAADQCGPVVVALDGVTSSEPDDVPGTSDGATTGDVQDVSVGTLDGHFLIRAERSSLGAGRTYVARYRVTDVAGHVTPLTASVTVPHDIAGVTDPISIRLSQAMNGTLVQWDPVPGADHYDVVLGDLDTLRALDPGVSLGPPICLVPHVTSTDSTGFEYPYDPDVGSGFFFLVDYVDASGRSGYGSESGPFDLQPVVPVDICP